jgi:tetratricopeptide (TPR) repeat protein
MAILQNVAAGLNLSWRKTVVWHLEKNARECKTLYMTQHGRIPAIVAIVLTALVGLGVFALTGQFGTTDLAHATLQDLEKRIVGSKEGRVWKAYGDKLREQGRYDAAAKAYHKAVELQPDLMDARLNEGVALGQWNADAFFDYVSQLTMNYPKVAVNLMERPELGAIKTLTSDARWEMAKTAAQAQAID